MAETVASSWQRISTWLRVNAPVTMEQIEEAATAEDIAAAEVKMGVKFPEDLRQFFMTIACGREYGIFPSVDEWDEMAFIPMTLEAAVNDWEMLKDLVEMGDFADRQPQSADGIANDWWNLGWIPCADDGGGDYWCIDLAPTELGVCGQLITHNHESGEHEVIASSLSSYLSELADQLEAGKLQFDEDYGLGKIEE